jgi:hypothetical protein
MLRLGLNIPIILQSTFSQWFYYYRAKTVSENILFIIESKDTA